MKIIGLSIAFLTLIGLMTKMVIRPVINAIRRFNDFLDAFLGQPATETRAAVDGVLPRLSRIEKAQADHLEWHGHPGGQPASNTTRPPNSGRPRKT